MEQRGDLATEFGRVEPQVEGRSYRYACAQAAGACEAVLDRLVKLGVETGRAVELPLGPRRYPSEAIFARRPGAAQEDDGYVLSLVYEAAAHATHLAAFDARPPNEGPVYRQWFDHRVPLTFQGASVPVGPG